MTEMIKINVIVEEGTECSLSIPALIGDKNMPVVLKTMRIIFDMIPEKEIATMKKGRPNPLLMLSLEEMKQSLHNYDIMGQKEFTNFLDSKYGVRLKNWKSIIALMGRLRGKIKRLEAQNESNSKQTEAVDNGQTN